MQMRPYHPLSRSINTFVLACSIAALLAPQLSAQTTITYTNGQTDPTAYSTTAPNNPTTLDLASGTATQTGLISGTGGVIKTGAGTLTLSSGSHTYTGTTTVNGGVLDIQGNIIANTSSNFFINNASTLRVSGSRLDFNGPAFAFDSNGGGTFDSVGGSQGGFSIFGPITFQTNGGAENFITGSSIIGININSTATVTFNVATGTNPTSDLTVSDKFTNAGSIVKTGAGTLTLSSSQSNFTGTTTVSAGTLRVTGNIGTSSLTTINGGTLSGSGTVGAVSVSAGGIVAPGDGIGTLSSKSVSLSSAGSVFQLQIDLGAIPAADLLNVTGGVTLNGSTLDLALANITPMGLSQTYLFLANDGADGVTGTFGAINGVPAGYTATVNYNYTGIDALGRVGNGNDIAITFDAASPVPEPAAAVWGLGVSLLALNRRRRAKVNIKNQAALPLD